MKKQANIYKEKIISEVKEGKKYSAYKTLRKLGRGPEEKERVSLKVAKFTDNNYSDQEAADTLAAHFSSISNSFPPLNISSLPSDVSNAITRGREDTNKLVLSEYEVSIS